MLTLWYVTTRMISGCKFLFYTHTLFEHVHTWAMFFLRHLANMSSMVPFWASTDSVLVPNLGARVRSHAVQRRLFIFLMTAAHISPNVFSLRNFHSNVHVLLLIVHSKSFIPIIHDIQASITSFFYLTNSFFHFFVSSLQAGCLRSLVSDTHVLLNSVYLSFMKKMI
jgi:hypothetical protein